MDILEIIAKKRDKGILSAHEIQELIGHVCNPDIPDYQISALLMAIYLNGMEDSEITHLTQAMAYSGDTLDFKDQDECIVDKHSTGGVGDKTSLVLIPILNAMGLKVAKLSGKGLGHTGGTLDKLSVFPGFRSNLSKAEILTNVREIGMVITGQTDNLVPADKRMYALRDLTATVDALPLIASSIMSKKIATGAKYILLDVKVGTGAMFTDLEKARTLARKMVAIGKALQVPTKAVLTDMNIPLGKTVGNALEVQEAIETLHGKGDARFRELCIQLTCRMMALVEESDNTQLYKNQIITAIDSGEALNKLKVLIDAQGGKIDYLDHPELIPIAPIQKTVYSAKKGLVQSINARTIGIASMLSGAGRARKQDTLDLGAGIRIHVEQGQQVTVGTPLLTLFSSDEQKLTKSFELCQSAICIGPEEPRPDPLIIEEY